nr:polysaccharide export protein EpsE [Pelomonas sp. Root1217]
MQSLRFSAMASGLLLGLGVAFSSAATAQTAPAAPAAAAEYRLGAGDVVRINVYQNPDLTLEARVSETGVISYPLLGNIQIGGLGVSAAERLIADGLKKGNFVKQPQVSLALLQVRGNQVSVLGQVNRPGRYPLEVADTRLTDLLATAGGVAATGGEVLVITGTRDRKPFRTELELPSLFAPNGRSQDFVLQNGDVIWVDRFPLLYIYGEVQRPGQIRLDRGMTLMQALAAGGGLNQRGTERGIRVHRKGADGKVQVLQPSMDEPLKDGDIVYVRESLF